MFYFLNTCPSFLNYLAKILITLVIIYKMKSLIGICANSVKDSIIEEVGPEIFSIMCAEAR